MEQLERAAKDRRSGKDRRNFSLFTRFFAPSSNPRSHEKRRVGSERRSEWVRTSRWSSINLKKYSISKYLRPY